MYNIHLLPGSFGDAILIEYGQIENPKYILIDGGPFFAFDEIDKVLKEDYPELKSIELLVVTHIDIDHIDGIIVMLNQKKLPFEVKEIWFNGYDQINELIPDKLGAKQGEYLSALIKKLEIPHNQKFNNKAVIVGEKLPVVELDEGMKLTLVSPTVKSLLSLKKKWDKTLKDAEITPGDKPGALKRLENDYRYEYKPKDLLGSIKMKKLLKHVTKDDKSPANLSSIAFIAEYDEVKCLFAADVPSNLLLESLNKIDDKKRLKLDAWKLAHHGSKKSTSRLIMEKVECNKMLISTNGKRFYHPDTETIAKLIDSSNNDLELYFNYKTEYNKDWDKTYLKNKYKYKCFYPTEEHKGIRVELTD